ncbi:DUF6319 family protein [Actinokineospora pegani]|uniref:DUF6319 family protein n=1 Tax=Actinokineospora pegani TaxID=2654637 RepID=UPI0012E9DB10|nr:DUF6319 family protein [Actinokineospora pegani]
MAKALTAEDIEGLRAALAAGKPTPVWFTGAAVGVDPGAAGKVVAFDDPPDGDFIQVRPAGSRDVLSFSPGELTQDKPATPPRKAAPRPAPAPAAPAPAVVVGIEAGAEPPPPAKRATRKTAQPVEITVTLHATPEGDWSVDVLVGKRRTVKWAPVPAGDVGKLSRFLPAEVGEAVNVALLAAKERAEQRVLELKEQLETAQRALRDLG